MEFTFDDARPVYLQMAEQIENAIIAGLLAPGSKLPSVRELASVSKTNPNTVQKALHLLEEKQLICTRRTSGKFVCENAGGLDQRRKEKAARQCRDLIQELYTLGFTKLEMTALLQQALDEIHEPIQDP